MLEKGGKIIADFCNCRSAASPRDACLFYLCDEAKKRVLLFSFSISVVHVLFSTRGPNALHLRSLPEIHNFLNVQYPFGDPPMFLRRLRWEENSDQVCSRCLALALINQAALKYGLAWYHKYSVSRAHYLVLRFSITNCFFRKKKQHSWCPPRHSPLRIWYGIKNEKSSCVCAPFTIDDLRKCYARPGSTSGGGGRG